MESTYYPTAEEVNELLEVAERYGMDFEHEAARPLYFAASGCKAEAVAYHNLLAEVTYLGEGRR